MDDRSVTVADQSLLATFNVASAQIGADPLLVQGAGGNTSIKLDDTLWIKASGQWLADAAERDIMVPVTLSALCRAFDRGESVENANRFLSSAASLRPSIETAMHALLPGRVVLHVHCVATIAIAVQNDAPALLARRLDGLAWNFVPYVRPGQPLAEAIAARPGFDVLVLGNHGLTVSADTVEASVALLHEVSGRLQVEPRSAPAPDFARLNAVAEGTDYLPAPAAIHGLATDTVSLAAVITGSLYPDHVIFLGPGVVTTPDGKVPLVVVPGAGALLRRDASASARAMARCLADVAARIPAGADITTLTRADEAALLGWEAETYRQGLATR
jgi:rhamnose utilization protein RhaD (predicted bifunctional aldolase and dehydrogenase)